MSRSNSKLVPALLLGLSAVALFWAWASNDAEYKKALKLIERRNQCTELLAELNSLADSTASIKIREQGKNSAAQLRQIVSNHAPDVRDEFFANETRIRQVGKTGVREYQIGIPTLSMTPAGSIKLIEALLKEMDGLQVNSITYGKGVGTRRPCKVDLDLRVLGRDSE